MFPVAVVLCILGYTLMYCGLGSASNGGTGPTVWEAFGWGEGPSIGSGLGTGAGSAAGNALNNLQKAKPSSANPLAPPSFQQL